MKSIYLTLFTVMFLVSCSDSQENLFVSTCVAETPGGDSYVAACQCIWSETLSSLTSDEEAAMRRDFNEMGDQAHAIQYSVKAAQATQVCMSK